MLSVKVSETPQCLGSDRVVPRLPLLLRKLILGRRRGEGGRRENIHVRKGEEGGREGRREEGGV